MKSTLLLTALLLVPAVAHAEAPDRRVVSVSGQGEISVAPDRARLALAVDQVAAEPKSAEAAVNKIVRAYLAELRTMRIEDKNISTASMSLNPEYVWDEKLRQNRITGYRARRDIQVLVSSLDKIGDLILAATRVGVNHVAPPQLETSKSKDLSRQALVQAAEDARGKAQLLADTLGVKLGPVRSLAAEDASPPVRPMEMRAMSMKSAADSGNVEMGFEAGEIKVSASVRAEFDLIAP